MQIDVDGNEYDERTSKEDDRYSFSISYDPELKLWFVDCWIDGDNRWNKTFSDKAKAIAEFNRFP